MITYWVSGWAGQPTLLNISPTMAEIQSLILRNGSTLRMKLYEWSGEALNSGKGCKSDTTGCFSLQFCSNRIGLVVLKLEPSSSWILKPWSRSSQWTLTKNENVNNSSFQTQSSPRRANLSESKAVVNWYLFCTWTTTHTKHRHVQTNAR